MTRLPLSALLAALLSAPAAFAAPEGWTDDYEAAKAKAEKENKDLLLDFTGSDWCGWCIKLKQEVFDQQAFKAKASKEYVFVEVDFPQRKQLPEKVKAQNQRLEAMFGIQGFPTIFLADAQGRVWGKAGYEAGGPENYLRLLGGLKETKKKRDEFFSKAEAAEGVEKARLLDQGLAAVPADFLIGYEKEMADIVALDAENAGGLKAKYAGILALQEVRSLAQERKFDEAIRKADEAVKEEAASPPAVRQAILCIKASILLEQKDRAGAIATFKAAREAAPDGPYVQAIDQQLKALGGQPQPAPKTPPKKGPPKKG